MPQKRNHTNSFSGPSPQQKRARPSNPDPSYDQDDDETPNAVTPYEKPRNHPVFGQKSAFPGLDNVDGEELFYGPAEDGLEYLRMVRSEANSLPTLFNAPAATESLKETTEVNRTQEAHNQHQQEDKPQDGTVAATKRVADGIYSDGVYIGLSTTNPSTDSTFSDAQASYYNLLHHRFLLLRSILKCTPPSEAISALDDSHPISFPRSSKNAQKEWRRLLLAVDPQTVQLACMDMDTVLGVLVIVARLISENVRNGDAVLVRRIGAWAWGLLGKCREAGQLGAREFGDIRELGKRAVRILKKIREEETQANNEENQDENEDEPEAQDSEEEGDPSEEKDPESMDTTGDPTLDQPGAEKGTDADKLEQAKARLKARVSAAQEESIPQKEVQIEDQGDGEATDVDVGTQTRAMLDMIITVIGEHYGQRDLLEAREIWTEEEQRFW